MEQDIENIEVKEFFTDNLGIAAYVDQMGLKYEGSRLGRGKNGKPKVYFVFLDPRGLGTDFEKKYIFSEEKKHRDLVFYYRNEVENMLEAADSTRPMAVQAR